MTQTALIIVHTWVFLYTVYVGSETMYFVTQFVIEFGYLIIRVSMSGALSMATTDFLDFLTLAVPLFFMCFEVLEISNFILDHNPKDNRSNSRSLKWGLISIGAVVSAVGGVVIGICFYKGFIQGCPSVDPTESIDLVESETLFGEIYKLQHGVFQEAFCYAWVFNLWLSPGCACYYLVLQPLALDESQNATSFTCAGLAKNEHEVIKPFFPYLEQLRFLHVAGDRLDNSEVIYCYYLTQQDFELVSNWTYLRVLRWPGFGHRAIPPAWQSLKDLVSIELSTSAIQNLEKATFDSWPLLESFVCVGCRSLQNMTGLVQATLPRLNNVQIYGVRECISLPEEVNQICVPAKDPPNATCEGIPQWYLQGFLDMAAQTQTTKCAQPSCSQYFDYFSALDQDGNGVLNAKEIGIMNFNNQVLSTSAPNLLSRLGTQWALEAWKTQQIECFTKEAFRVAPFPINSTGYELSDGLPMVAFLAANFRYTMCTDCTQFQEESDNRYAVFLQGNEELAASGMSEECAEVSRGGVPFDVLDEACTNQRTDCDAGMCFGMGTLLQVDRDHDFHLNATEFKASAEPFGLEGLWTSGPEVTVECFRRHSPRCFDDSNSTNITIASTMIMGPTLFNWPPDDISRCTDCNSYQRALAAHAPSDPYIHILANANLKFQFS